MPGEQRPRIGGRLTLGYLLPFPPEGELPRGNIREDHRWTAPGSRLTSSE